MAFIRRCIVTLIIACAAVTAAAQDRPDRREPPKAAHGGLLHLLPADSVTEHSLTTARGKITYTATAGTLALYDQSGEQSASVFYTAYVAKDAGANRPLTFVFNGGPGAASAFLHLGLVGPKILDFGPGARDAATAQLRDNPDTWLAFTDLVLIDPIGTGWSRTAKPDDAKGFWNVQQDANSIAKAIALYVAHNNRTGSPKYLFGESYGGFRAVKVARALQREQGIVVAGIVMLSPLLDGALTFGGDRYALGAALQFPSLAAAELERRGTFTPSALAEAEHFAMTDYLTTLAGPPPQGDKARAFYAQVARLTGLSADNVAQARGFISDAYAKEFRAADHKVVSIYDATFAVDDPFPEQRSSHGGDPILDGVVRAYSGAFAAYARNELGFKTEMTYTLLSSDVGGHWDWGHGGRQRADSENDIRVLLSFTPSFRLLIAHGYSDLVTPYGMTRYVLDHLPTIGAPNRVQLKLYRGGHMLYLDPASRKAFTDDAAAFLRAGE
ncbi:MAG TPA: carboxypeptidase [Pseudolabrys sp.]|nr:carboxypeptidase [Pseudolabrys sp.]